MDFLLLPILVGMLFLAVPGANLTANAFQKSAHKGVTLAALISILFGLFLVAFIAPHAYFHHRSVATWMLLLGLISAHLCLGVIGCVWGAWSHSTQHKQPNLLAAALVLSAAFFPIAWFTLTAPLLKLLSVQRVE